MWCPFVYSQMHHTMDGLDMLDPTGSMTTLTPMSENPISSSHHQLHGSYHSMNHMMGHHHGGPLGSHSSGTNNCMCIFKVPSLAIYTDSVAYSIEEGTENMKHRNIISKFIGISSLFHPP